MAVLVCLKDGGGAEVGDRSLKSSLDRFGFPLIRNCIDDRGAFHDLFDAHGNCLFRDIVKCREPAFSELLLAADFIKRDYEICFLRFKVRRRIVECKVSVFADADECDDCPSRVLCTVSYSSFDGKASFTGEGEAVYLPEGPSVVGDGFSLTVPLDLLTLRRFRERMYSSDRDTRAYLETAVFDGASDAASSRRAELSRALALCRPGSRMARLPNDPDDADRGEW